MLLILFRSRLNRTNRKLDRESDEIAIQGQKIRFLARYLEGNSTELRGRIDGNELRLDDQDRRLTAVKTLADGIEQEVRQQTAADLVRHNDLDSRLSRDEKRIQHLEETSQQNSDTLVTLSHSVSEESNDRQSALTGINNEIQSLHSTVTKLEVRESNSRQALAQANQLLAENSATQTRHSGINYIFVVAASIYKRQSLFH